MEFSPKEPSSFSPAPVSVAIVAYDTPVSELKDCLISILESVAFYLHEIAQEERSSMTIVDTGGPQLERNQFESCLREYSSVVDVTLNIISGHGNIGYGGAQNLAFSRQRDGVHIFMNPDVRLAPDALYQGVRFLTQHEDAVLASPACTGADKEPSYLCKRYPSLAVLF